jgi:hypothetical protein
MESNDTNLLSNIKINDIFNKILINQYSLIIDHRNETDPKLTPIRINYDKLYDSYILTTQVRYIISKPYDLIISDYYSNIKYVYNKDEYESGIYTFTADLYNSNSHRYFDNISATCCKFIIKHVNDNKYSFYLYDDFIYQKNKKEKSILSNTYDYIMSYFKLSDNDIYTFSYANLFYGLKIDTKDQYK